jgi:uncharacterized protein (TIGR02147 family)
MKDLFTYNNFRKYLLDYYKNQKRTVARYSYRNFSEMAGGTSRAFILNIIVGRRAISQSTITRLCIAFKFTPIQTLFFEHLVYCGQATESWEKKSHTGQLKVIKKIWSQRNKIKGIE